MNAIFLDIDGVLNNVETKDRTKSCAIGVEDSKVEILKEIVAKTNSRIVLTSTWKIGWNKDLDKCDMDAKYLIEKLAKQNLFILDKTEDLGFNRGQGIYDWIEKHNVDNWLVIDDEFFDFDKEIKQHLIKTKFYSPKGGLQKRHIKMALERSFR